MKDIVEKTGMSKGAFYHYFNSKEQIFHEIIEQAFTSFINIDYRKFKKDSLYGFYHEYIGYVEHINASYQNTNNGDNTFDLNYCYLIFDAIRIFPDFRDKMRIATQDELKAWEEIIHMAKENGEIRSSMSDEEIASVFVQTNNGISMNNIMIGKSGDTTKVLLALWNSFYSQIKS